MAPVWDTTDAQMADAWRLLAELEELSTRLTTVADDAIMKLKAHAIGEKQT